MDVANASMMATEAIPRIDDSEEDLNEGVARFRTPAALRWDRMTYFLRG